MKTNTFHVSLVLIAFAFAFAMVTAGCNTTRGIGKDIEVAGETIEEAADEAEDRLRDDL